MAKLPLEHITVLDLTLHRAGPTCARQFADWGAKVIKIEVPGGPKGEATGANRLGPDYQNLHRNKLNMTINLKSEEGRAIFLDLAKTRRRGDRELPLRREASVGHRLRGGFQGQSAHRLRQHRGLRTGRARREAPGRRSDRARHGRPDVDHRRARPRPDARRHSDRGPDRGPVPVSGMPAGADAARPNRRGPMGAHVAPGIADLHARFPGGALAPVGRSRQAGRERSSDRDSDRRVSDLGRTHQHRGVGRSAVGAVLRGGGRNGFVVRPGLHEQRIALAQSQGAERAHRPRHQNADRARTG